MQRLVIRGRSRGLGLGSYALVSLAEARELALANRKPARAGGPLAAKRRTEGMPSFEEASERVVAIHSGGWKDGGKSAKQWRAPEPGRRRGRVHRSSVPGPARQGPLRRSAEPP